MRQVLTDIKQESLPEMTGRLPVYTIILLFHCVPSKQGPKQRHSLLPILYFTFATTLAPTLLETRMMRKISPQ